MKRNDYEVYAFVRKFKRKYGYSPSLADIVENTGLKYTNDARASLNRLRDAELLSFKKNKGRTISFPWECPLRHWKSSKILKRWPMISSASKNFKYGGGDRLIAIKDAMEESGFLLCRVGDKIYCRCEKTQKAIYLGTCFSDVDSARTLFDMHVLDDGRELHPTGESDVKVSLIIPEMAGPKIEGDEINEQSE